MNVLVLGVGKMGYGLLKDLAAQSEIRRIVAADINKKQAEEYVKRVGSNKIIVQKVDVTNNSETVSLMKKGFDVVASALPRPFCDAAAKAAIEAGIGYADVAASFATIFDLDKLARDAGITVVPHIGLDIGIDRVLCGVGARKLDRSEKFHVWCGGFPQKGTPGYNNLIKYKISWYWPYAVETNLQDSTVLKNGDMVTIPAISDPEEIMFPEPIGGCEAFTTGSLLDVVEHLNLEEVKDAWAKTVRWPGHCEIWQRLKELGILDEELLKVRDDSIKPRDFFIALGEKNLQYNPDEGDAICQRVEVSGRKNGEFKSYIYEFIDFHDFENDISAMARTTAFPCSIVAQMIARGEIKECGVIHPVKIGYDEKLSDKFFDELGNRNINITEYEKTSLN